MLISRAAINSQPLRGERTQFPGSPGMHTAPTFLLGSFMHEIVAQTSRVDDLEQQMELALGRIEELEAEVESMQVMIDGEGE